MKKKMFVFLLFFLFFGKISALSLTSYSDSAILIEPTTNTILYELNKDKRKPPASMTKLMTMLLIIEAIDDGRIKLNDIVTVSKNAAGMGGSQVFLEENMKIEVEQLLKGIAIASGNDAAVAMAEHIAGSTDEFVKMMNDKVKELGLSNTHFVNVHGLDAENHYSSAYDMAQIARELLKHEKILEYTSLYEDYLIKPDGSKTWLVNTNKLVRFYDGVDGLKTGYTSTAKYCLTATAQKNNIRFVTVTMGVDTSEHRSADTTSMLNYAFANYKLNTIIKKDQVIGEIEVKKGKNNIGKIVASENVTDLLKQNEKKTYSYNIIKDKVEAPLKKGDVVGKLEVIDNNGKKVKVVNLVINESIDKHSFFSLFGDLFKKIVGGYI
ncbi:MAG TPA: D-alanyl-D-alanine carboxypeptidase [Candidatus Coprovivens excrementavium]|nr:D-alanyl-D-alanine carboxypeptidase [Candidatus Coprovivens excrementavium]